MDQHSKGKDGSSPRLEAQAPPGAARVLVQASLDAFDQTAAAIAAIPGVEVCDRDQRGKLALRLQYGNTGHLAATLRKISLVQGVTSATLAARAAPACGTID